MSDSHSETPAASPAQSGSAEGVTSTPDVKSPSAAPSQAEPKGSENKSILDAVKGALNGSEKSPGSEIQDPKAGKVEVAEPTVKEGEDSPFKGFTLEEVKALSKKTNDRVRGLWQQGRDLGTKVAELEPKAKQFDEFTGLMQRNRLSQSDVNNTLEIAGYINTGQPQKALEKLAPIVKGLLEAAGAGNLPADLQQEVEAGSITEARARELAQARASAKLATDRQQVSEQERQQSEQQRQTREFVSNAVKTADAWTEAKKANDPDWNLKSDRINELVELHVRREGFPQDRESMVKVLDGILTKVNAELKKFVPRPKAQKEAATGSTSSSSVAAPKTTKEAVLLGLKQAREG